MLKRILTAVIAIPVVTAIIILGNPWLKYVVMAASLIGVFEFYRVTGRHTKPFSVLGYLAVIVQYAALGWVMKNYFVFSALCIMAALTVMVICYPEYTVSDAALTILPVFYVGLLFSYLVLLRDRPDGVFWIGLLAISAWGSDTCAYFTGITMGKHKLAPQLSPKKTIEGSAGGILGAGILGFIYTMAVTAYSMQQLRKEWVIIVCAVMAGAAISQIGDLAASAIKRFYDQKDYGNILPGHGGILDRCDSFIFVAPVIYLFASLV